MCPFHFISSFRLKWNEITMINYERICIYMEEQNDAESKNV